jgi:hypothetical protein
MLTPEQKERAMSKATISINSNVKKCRARAYAYLVELIGARPETLTWDTTHCLQGHAHLGCREIVVIATRDASREPVVLTAPDWDAVRRSPADQRRGLIESCAITDHPGLVALLDLDELGSHPLAA